MANEDRLVRGLGGPGGIKCRCCGGGGGRHRPGAKRAIRKGVRAVRRAVRRDALNEVNDD
jgi:hypothetical protein